jgi:hypothetical protein
MKSSDEKGNYRFVFSSCLRLAMFSVKGIAAVLMVVALVAISGADDVVETVRDKLTVPYGFSLQYVIDGTMGDSMLFFMPVLCALPYAAGYVEDLKSGAVRLILPRTRRVDYLLGKITACMAAGGLTLAIGVTISAVLALILLRPLEVAAVAEGTLSSDAVAAARMHELIKRLWEQLMFLFLSGMLWSGFGMLASGVTESGYVAYLSPFILYYLLIIICERYFTGIKVIYPKEWINPGEWWPYGRVGVAILMAELLLLLVTAFIAIGEKRLSRL